MGIKSKIQSKVGNAFSNSLSDAVSNIKVRHNEYTIDPDTNTTSNYIAEYSVRCIVGNYKQKEINNSSIMPTDIKVLIIQSELNYTPSVDDLIFHNQIEYKVVTIMKDPVSAMWVLQCRK